MSRTAVLAYSGGLDTTCIIAWLKELYGYDEVVAVLVDVGQEFDLEQSQERGYAAGADDVLLVDRREAFANDAVRAGAEDERALRGQVPADLRALAAGDRRRGRGARRGARRRGRRPRLHRQGQRPAPLRARLPRELPGREGDRAAARQGLDARRGDRVRARQAASRSRVTKSSPFSFDENLFGRSIEAGILEDPWEAPPEEPYLFTSDPSTAPEPTEVVIGFEGGLPVSIDGEALPLVELIAQLNRQAGAYGIGRIDMIENRAIGIKSREVYEAPAAMTLIAAHRALEDVVLTKPELNVKRGLEDTWAKTVYDGLWFSPVREAIDAFVDKTQELVIGRGARPAARGRGGRQRPALRARALRGDARLVRDRRDVPARRGGGLHPAGLARGRAGGGSGAGGAGLTLWAGRVEGELDPEVWELVKANDAELFPYDVEGTPPACAAPRCRRAAHRRGARGDRVAALRPRRVDDRARRRGRALGDRAAARRPRPQGARGPLAERPGRDRVPAVGARGLRRGARGDRRVRAGRSSTAPRSTPGR